MVDNRTPDVRSRIMAAVRQKDTGPEMAVRRLLHRMGYRYSLHRRDLPGRPDLVFRSRRKVVFVHGCFWHGHDCRKGRLPTSRLDYWKEKVSKNVARDARNIRDLIGKGWEVCVVWECEIAHMDSLRQRLVGFLEGELS
ncbi:MAG: DNA mismatch endonuclease Vsr [Gammaproteobacteria bacterium]|nr:DNA mismatch endonuclease Vsr [Gammaproteobacteria bacterium]MYG97019.1 DNA mismatch endonuclease Vsr [Gammaproteobacteria bacterium]